MTANTIITNNIKKQFSKNCFFVYYFIVTEYIEKNKYL